MYFSLRDERQMPRRANFRPLPRVLDLAYLEPQRERLHRKHDDDQNKTLRFTKTDLCNTVYIPYALLSPSVDSFWRKLSPATRVQLSETPRGYGAWWVSPVADYSAGMRPCGKFTAGKRRNDPGLYTRVGVTQHSNTSGARSTRIPSLMEPDTYNVVIIAVDTSLRRCC